MEDNEQNLYLPGEEKFGFFTSHGYSLSRIIPTFRRFYSFVIDDISHLEFSRIMDIGSGNGYVLTQVIRKNASALGFGIDPSSYMVRISNKRAKKTNLSNRITFSLGSSHDIPFKGPFDIIYSTMSFHHWKDKEKAVTDIMHLLAEDGKFLIYEASPEGGFNRKLVKSHLMSRGDFTSLSEHTGVSLGEIIENNGFIRASFVKL
jgi:ubiquinone/menaquinone biosynthesis C-methylase UbiE